MITIISGTNRPHSNTFKLSSYYQHQLLKKGVPAHILSLTDLSVDFISADMYKTRSDAFLPYQERINATEKFIFVIPEYNGSFPGILKTFVDACKFPDSFFNKKAALVGLSSGKYGNIRGVDHFTGVCHYVRLHVLPLRIHIPHIFNEFDTEGNLYKEDTVRFTNEQIEEFIRF
ncbi:NADPH-dependent FMN reductase [Parapedobacter koreensis]|uniref:NAD(P)H-dependent FMN reductase n=1 Tax=Parapedobacter koreensis TaxID=332977 RepID=A0A1H7G0P7_9SPHI|nr:NAD(P)H-dependent oxidoreductase [Parapedobacter koreensis]SEK31698.1 NAD(P)H-dependent FMN reductase [Parapedobacter koreensis]